MSEKWRHVGYSGRDSGREESVLSDSGHVFGRSWTRFAHLWADIVQDLSGMLLILGKTDPSLPGEPSWHPHMSPPFGHLLRGVCGADRSSSGERARRGIGFLESDLSTPVREVVFKESNLIAITRRPHPANVSIREDVGQDLRELCGGREKWLSAGPFGVVE
jgi:hypothetical protein